jgi:hypothetical protein
MSQANVKVADKPLTLPEHSSRTLDQRLGLRFPRLAHICARLLARLPPSSRLRRAGMRRAVRLAAEAFNRRDLDAFLLGIHPCCEFHPPREYVEAALLEPCYRGPAGYRRFVSAWSQVWGADLRLEQLRLIDLGNHLVVLAEETMRGQASGVLLTGKYGWVSTLKDGRAIREQHYLDHAEALEAVGPA